MLAALLLVLSGCVFRTPDELYQLPQKSPGYEMLTKEISEVQRNLEIEFGKVESAIVYAGDHTSNIQLQDLNSDGTPEIPVQTVFPGYEGNASDQNIRLTRWMTEEGGILTEKYRGYYSVSDGYAFMLPKEWQSEVTAVSDGITGDIVFYRFTGSLSEPMQELMRIGMASDRETRDSLIEDGYKLLHSRGNAYYFMNVIYSTDSLYLPESKLLGCFLFVNG